MRKIEKPEDVVVVSRRDWIRLSSLAAAGSVMFGGLAAGATERERSADGSHTGSPYDSSKVFGGEETSAITGWEIIAAWVALTTRSDKLTDCLLYRGQNGECSNVATGDLNLNDTGWRKARDFLLANPNYMDKMAEVNQIWRKLAKTYNTVYDHECPVTSQIRDLAQGLARA